MRITPGAIGTVTLTGTPDVKVVPPDDFQAANAVTVGATATSVLSSSSGTRSVLLKAAVGNSEDIYFGDSGLSNPGVTEDGLPLAAGGAMVLDTTAAIYAISASGSQKVYVAYTAQT